tara:strand:- start:60 stop:1634 length:1575 start_codon:yes stop_codon:yes gene_type:complete
MGGSLTMAKPLISASIAAPAFYGLNTQESGVTLQEGFALHADNCIIDKQGRLSSRKGWATQTVALGGSTGANVDVGLLGITDFKDITGAETRISWSATKFYKGTADLIEVTPNTADTIAAGNWQSATLNDHQFFFQRGYEPLIYTNESGSTEFESYSEHDHTTSGYPEANTVLAAYGRLWAADTTTNKTTVYFTTVLDGAKFSTGTSGTLDISSVLTQGMDEIVTLGAHNGYLIIFCKNNIIIYSDGDNFQGGMTVSNLTLVEVIEGVGCIARDSVQNTGEDILFLSNTGIRSLNRTVQEKSQPMRDISKNIRNDIIQAVEFEDVNLIKSVYSPNNAIYLLMTPTTRQTFCFDTRAQMEDGSFRVTVWPSFLPASFLSAGADIFLAAANGIAKYTGYQDNGAAYQMSYYSNYFDLGIPNVNKMVKRLTATTVGATGQSFALKIGYEYSPIYYSQAFTLETGVVYEYGVSEYNLSEYAGSVLINEQSAPASGAGNILQVGFAAMIDGAALSLQKLSIYAKQGKVL